MPHTFSNQNPTIINVWSRTCAPCLAELAEWSAHRDKLLATGADIITFSTDHLAGETDATATAVALAKTGSTFPNFKISEASLSALDDLQRSVLDRWKPLPVPSSFLIDTHGELVAIYKGKVSVEQLIHDLPLSSATAEQRRDAAIPFPGRWVGGAGSADSKRVASMMLDHNRIEAATDYLDLCAERLEASPELARQKRKLGDIYFMSAIIKSSDPQRRREALGQLARARDLIPDDIRIRRELGKQFLAANKQREALSEFSAASKLNPGDFGLQRDLALMNFRLGEYQAAHDLLSQLVTIQPQDGLLHYHLANAQIRTGRIPEAIAGYRRTLSLSPNTLEAANNLAWILAAHPDENLRSAEEALALAERLCSITKQEHVPFLDTLSIALANSGDYQRAIDVANKAVALYPEESSADAAPIRARIKLYQSGKPYREVGWQ
jgi:Flp pilus assembly protein TadD